MKKYIQGCKEIFGNKCTMWLTIGGMFRFWQGFTLTYYSFTYFTLFGSDELYGTLNALAVLIGGFTSSLIAGIISDKYEPVNYRTKSYVIVFQSMMAIPVCCIAFLTASSFGLSITFLFLEYLLAEGWMPAAVSMLMTVIDNRFKGVAVGIFLFFTTIAGTVAVSVDGLMIKKLEATDDID